MRAVGILRTMYPDQPMAFFKYMDAVVVGLLVVVITYILLRHAQRHCRLLPSISETIAYDKRSSLLFSVVMTACVPLYYAYVGLWIGPRYAMPPAFYWLLIVSIIAEFIFVWVPARGGRAGLVHTINACFVGAVMLLAPLLILLAGTGLSGVAHGTLLGYVLLVSIGFPLFVLARPLRRFSWQFEAAYIVLFWVVLAIAAHA